MDAPVKDIVKISSSGDDNAFALTSQATAGLSIPQSFVISDDRESRIDEVAEDATTQSEDDLVSPLLTITTTSNPRFILRKEECYSLRSSLRTHLSNQFGSLTAKAFGRAAHVLVDPILDRQKKRFLQPVLDRAQSLWTGREWKKEIARRLCEEENERTGRILEALR